METQYPNPAQESLVFTRENKLLRASFAWMALAMALTVCTSLVFATIPSLASLLLSESDGILKPTIFAWVVVFAPILFVLLMSSGLQRFSFPALATLFVIYSIVNGLSFSFIFFLYQLGSIIKVFLSTAALFGIMAIAGYTTRTDLTKLGSILFIGLIGVVVATLINMFMKSPGMDYLISVLGVIIFTGLTAYDVQKLKALSTQAQGGSVINKLGIMGALTLYLDFINLFLFLLRLFGGRKS
jgi:FtsH-binding integral membrane protein